MMVVIRDSVVINFISFHFNSRHVNSKEVRDSMTTKQKLCLMITNNETNLRGTFRRCRFFSSLSSFYCHPLKIKLSHTNQTTDNQISLRLSISVTALDESNKQTITIICFFFSSPYTFVNRKKAHWYFFDIENWMVWGRERERETEKKNTKTEKKKSVS